MTSAADVVEKGPDPVHEAAALLLAEAYPSRPQRGPLRGFVCCGPPGAGKSHVSLALGARYGAHQLASDAIRRRLGWRPDDWRAFGVATLVAEGLLGRGESVVLDYNSSRPRERRKAQEHIRALGAEAIIVFVDTPEAIRTERLAGRHGGDLAPHEVVVPDEVARRAAAAFVPPGADEGRVLRIDGTAPIEAQLDALDVG